MSSRRLLCLIDALPPDSAYWKERRDGDWSDQEYIAAGTLNELRLQRADNAALHANHKMDISLAQSPAQLKKEDELGERVQEVRQHFISQLNGKN